MMTAVISHVVDLSHSRGLIDVVGLFHMINLFRDQGLAVRAVAHFLSLKVNQTDTKMAAAITDRNLGQGLAHTKSPKNLRNLKNRKVERKTKIYWTRLGL